MEVCVNTPLLQGFYQNPLFSGEASLCKESMRLLAMTEWLLVVSTEASTTVYQLN